MNGTQARRSGRTLRGALAGVAMLAGFGIMADTARAQSSFSNQCGSTQGLCPVGPAPVGTPCFCASPMGPAAGQIVMLNGFAQQSALSNTCRTFRGFCQTSPAPVGSQCGCFGDFGTVVLR